MDAGDALELMRTGVPPGGAWADLGAGTGTFTRALAELLGPEGSVNAIDQSDDAIRALGQLQLPRAAALHVQKADFTRPWEQLGLPVLDGILMANALHFAKDQVTVLRHAENALRPGGRLLLVEYDRSRGNPWVPFPVPLKRFRALAAEVGLVEPRELARRRSLYGRTMYAAMARRADANS